MKKLFGVGVGAGMALLIATLAPAQNIGIGFHGLYAFNFDGEVAGAEWEPEDTIAFGVTGVYRLGPYLRFDLGGDWINTERQGTRFWDITLIPVTAGLRAGGRLGTTYLYAGGGAGWSFNDLDAPERELKDSAVYFALIGAEFALGTEDVTLRAESRYNWLKPESRDKDTGIEEGWKLDHIQLRAGLTFYF